MNSLKNGNEKNIQDLLKDGICVKHCPRAALNDPVLCKTTARYETDFKFSSCIYYPNAVKNGAGVVSLGDPFKYESKTYLNHFCVPTSSDYVDSEIQQSFMKAFRSSPLLTTPQAVLRDVINSWPVLVVCFLIALVLCFV